MEKIKPLEKEIAFPGKFSDALRREVDLTSEVLEGALGGTVALMDEGYRVPAFSDHFTTNTNDLLGYWTKLWIDESGSLKGLFEALTEEIREKVKKLDSSLIIQDAVKFGTRSNGLLEVPSAITRVDIVPQGAAVGTERFREAFAMAFGSPSHVQSKTAMIYMAKGAPMAGEPKKEETTGGLMAMLAAAFGLDGQAVSEEILEKLFVNQVLGAPEPDMIPAALENLVKNGAAAMAAFDAADVAEVVDDLAEEAEEAALMPEATVDEEKAMLREAAMSGLLATPGLDDADRAAITDLFEDIKKSSGFVMAFSAAKKLVAFRAKDPAIVALNTASPTVAARPAERKVNTKPETEESKNYRIAMSAENPLISALEGAGKLPKKNVSSQGQAAAEESRAIV